MSPEILWMICGGVVSILTDIVPGYSAWFDGLAKNYKRLFMIAVLLAISGSILALNCWDFAAPLVQKYVAVECSEAGILDFIEIFVLAVVGNQATFLIAPKAQRKIHPQYPA
jgi:hypothetical protein